jgi:hypothetical protein
MTLETTTVLVNDRWVTIRPIRSTDAVMEMDFVRKLSAAAKHYRYALGGKSDVRETAITGRGRMAANGAC